MGMEVTLGRAITIIIALAVVLLLMFGYSRIAGQASDTGGGMFSMFTDIMEFFGIRTGRISLESITITDIMSDGSMKIELVLIRPQGYIINTSIVGVDGKYSEYMPGERETDRRIETEVTLEEILTENYGEVTIRVTATRDGRSSPTTLTTRKLSYIRPGLAGITNRGQYDSVTDSGLQSHLNGIIDDICSVANRLCVGNDHFCSQARPICVSSDRDEIFGCFQANINSIRNDMRSNRCLNAVPNAYYATDIYATWDGTISLPAIESINLRKFELTRTGSNGNPVFDIEVENTRGYQIMLVVDGIEKDTALSGEDDYFILSNKEIELRPSTVGTVNIALLAAREGHEVLPLHNKDYHFIRPSLNVFYNALNGFDHITEDDIISYYNHYNSALVHTCTFVNYYCSEQVPFCQESRPPCVPVGDPRTGYKNCFSSNLNSFRTSLNSEEYCKNTIDDVYYSDIIYISSSTSTERPSLPSIVLERIELTGLNTNNNPLFDISINNARGHTIYIISGEQRLEHSIGYDDDAEFSITNFEVRLGEAPIGDIEVRIYSELINTNNPSLLHREEYTYLRPGLSGAEEYIGMRSTSDSEISGWFGLGINSGFYSYNEDAFTKIQTLCELAKEFYCEEDDSCDQIIYPCNPQINNPTSTRNHIKGFIEDVREGDEYHGCLGYEEDEESDSKHADRYIYCTGQFLDKLRDNLEHHSGRTSSIVDSTELLIKR